MGLVPEEDTITKGYFTPNKMENEKAYKVRVIDYKREEGGKYPDKEGYTTFFILEGLDPALADYLDDDGIVKFTCGSTRLRKEFFKKNVEQGDVITIMRSGEGFKTDYKIEVVEKHEETISADDLPKEEAKPEAKPE